MRLIASITIKGVTCLGRLLKDLAKNSLAIHVPRGQGSHVSFLNAQIFVFFAYRALIRIYENLHHTKISYYNYGTCLSTLYM